MRPGLSLSLGLAVALVGAACGGGHHVRYACGDGYRFTVTFRDTLALFESDTLRLTLHQTRSGSGIRYGDSTLALHAKGPDALLLHDDSVIHAACRVGD
jgi:membrane-bound inhibitor of C-type lysozyme